MSYHASDFLADLFGPATSTAPVIPEPKPQAAEVIPEPAAAPSFDPAAPDEAPSPPSGPQAEPDADPGGEPMADPATPSDPQAADLGPPSFDPAAWTRQPDTSGRWGWQRADLDGGGWSDFDELPNPDPCPVCASLELWETVAGDLDGIEPGRWRCLACDPPTTARGLAAEAVELRQRSTVGAGR